MATTMAMPDTTPRARRSLSRFIKKHKFWSIVILLVVLYLLFRGYNAFLKPKPPTTYTLTTVATSTVVSTISETGQVTANQQLSLTPKESGEITAIYVQPGQTVAAGQAIAQIDASDAVEALANAKLELQNEQIQYEQQTASSTLALNLTTAQNNVTNAQTALNKTHDSSYATLASTYTDLSTLISNLDSNLYDYDIPGRSMQQNIDALTDIVSNHDDSIGVFKASAENSYTAAVSAYNTAVAAYKATSLSASDDDLITLSENTYTATKAIAEAVKDAHDFFDRVNTDYNLYNLKIPSQLTTLLQSTNTDTNTVASDLSNTLTVKTNIISAEQSLAEAQDSLSKVQGGSNTLTVQQADLSLKQAQQSVTNAEQTLADYTVTAPFSGTIATVAVKKFDNASSGTTIATLYTAQKAIDVTVNEVDVAKLKVGQKATITFDALPDITLTGTVASVDSIGTVSQGVVSYDAVISLDTNNPSVKPGMSATANIILDTETGISVPASAIKSGRNGSYVDVFTTPTNGTTLTTKEKPTEVPVTTGLSDNTNTIVESGLTAGMQIVTATLTQTTTSASASSGAAGLTGGAGVRVGGFSGGDNATFRTTRSFGG